MISAIVLAAGKSTRMGRQKMLLPWGKTTVIEKVVATLVEGGIDDIHVVTGGSELEVKRALAGYRVNFAFNEDFANGEMLTSVKLGISDLGDDTDAVLIALGDQPQIDATIIEKIKARYLADKSKIIVPSFQMHRGHPWLIDKALWNEIYALQPPETLRNFLTRHEQEIDYIIVNSASVLEDLDTPGDYLKHHS